MDIGQLENVYTPVTHVCGEQTAPCQSDTASVSGIGDYDNIIVTPQPNTSAHSFCTKKTTPETTGSKETKP
ncbi:hypothetical protein BDF14DRAFT_1816460 [Spinellus fusiger]|nr:hypothetical protein BDF14DRAFT_1816460 [Spinellus fusiger]